MMVKKDEADHYIGGHWRIGYSELYHSANGVKLTEKEKQRSVSQLEKLLLSKGFKTHNRESEQTLIVYLPENKTINKNKKDDAEFAAPTTPSVKEVLDQGEYEQDI